MSTFDTAGMGEKRILLVGDANHQFVIAYATWVRKKTNYLIDCLSYSKLKNPQNRVFNELFQISYDKLPYRISKYIPLFRSIFRLYSYRRIIAQMENYDAVHFHFLTNDTFFLASEIKRKMDTKVILSIWGSDLYKLKESKRRQFFSACKLASYITFTNEKSIEYFSKTFEWQKDNLRCCRLGLSPLEFLRSMYMPSKECKRNLNIDTEKIAITVGYNGSPNQQHIKILQQFLEDKLLNLKDKISLIVPLTYGGSEKYKKLIIEMLNKLPYESVYFDSFLSDEKVAQLRIASDIMIQLQESDQFSGSMQEHMYAENVVITGSWLPYDILKERGVWFLEVSELSQLTKILPDVILNLPEYKVQASNNKDKIARLSLWENNIEDWVALYQG